MYKTIKTYNHDVGLSCCFRQWRAESHCHFLHGYALAVRLEFECDELDHRGWCVDFGEMKAIKQVLKDNFDHKLLVAEDDPHLDMLCSLQGLGLAEVVVLPSVGCEAFAHYVYQYAHDWLTWYGYAPRVRLASVTISEHGGNSSVYTGGEA